MSLQLNRFPRIVFTWYQLIYCQSSSFDFVCMVILRAYVEKYLLEKSRLVYQEHNERWVRHGKQRSDWRHGFMGFFWVIFRGSYSLLTLSCCSRKKLFPVLQGCPIKNLYKMKIMTLKEVWVTWCSLKLRATVEFLLGWEIRCQIHITALIWFV